MIKLSFIKESLLFTIGNALPIIASVILLPFYANYLSTTNYVALSFYIGISLLFQILFSFSFEQYYGVIYTEIKHDYSKIKLLNGSVFIYLIIQGFAIILLTLLIGQDLLEYIFQNEIPVVFFPYGFLSVLTGLCNALFKVSVASFIYAQKSKLFFLSNLTNFFATLIISLSGLLLFPNTLTGPIYGRFYSGIIILLFNFLTLKNHILWKLEWYFVKEFISKSWAVFTYVLITWITNNIDRYFLKSYVDMDNLASYDLIMKCFIGVEFLQNGLSMAIIPKVFDIWKEQTQSNFSLKSNRYFNIFILATAFTTVFFVSLLPFFIQFIIKDNKYYYCFSIISIIGVAHIFRSVSVPYYFALLYSKKTPQLLLLNVITILLQIVLSYLYIPSYGLMAALYISIITKIVIVILYHTYILKITHQNQINYFKWFGIPLLTSVAVFFLFYLQSENYVLNNIITFIFFIFISILIYKNELLNMYTHLLLKLKIQKQNDLPNHR